MYTLNLYIHVESRESAHTVSTLQKKKLKRNSPNYNPHKLPIEKALKLIMTEHNTLLMIPGEDTDAS